MKTAEKKRLSFGSNLDLDYNTQKNGYLLCIFDVFHGFIVSHTMPEKTMSHDKKYYITVTVKQ